MAKVRIDCLLVERGLVTSRERARRLVMAGDVLVAERPVTKPGAEVPADAPVRVRGGDAPFVSRGARIQAPFTASQADGRLLPNRARRANTPISLTPSILHAGWGG